MEGKKEGKGEENSQLGLYYKGQWKTDMKWGPGEEKTLVGTTFTGKNLAVAMKILRCPCQNLN